MTSETLRSSPGCKADRRLLEAQAAEAAKEGGFMGFRAERVSEGEQRMLDKLAEVLSAS
jgi:hypothetical protein